MIRTLCLCLLFVGACVITTQPARQAAPSPTTGAREVSGRVADYTTAPGGEMNGVVLDNGTRVHFPIHLGTTLLPIVQRGQLIRVVGRDEVGPDGRRRIDAATITSLDSGKSVIVASAPPPSPPPPPSSTTTPTGAELTTTEGRVTDYTTAPGGEMNGVILDNGKVAQFPTSVGSAVLPLVQRGTRIRVTGSEVTGPTPTVIEVSTITDVASGRTVDVASMQAPPPPRRALPPGAVAPP